MTVKAIKINEEEFFKSYKELVKLCLEEGDIIPGLLDVIEVPDEYLFTDKELEKMKLTEDSSKNRQDKRMELEVKLSEVDFDGDLQALSDEVNTIYNEELMAFIGRHPQYQKLIK